MNTIALSVLKSMHYDCKSEEGKILLSQAIFKIEKETENTRQIPKVVTEQLRIGGFPLWNVPKQLKGSEVTLKPSKNNQFGFNLGQASKLTSNECSEIIHLSQEGYTLELLSTMFKVSKPTISKVRSGAYNPKDGGKY